MKVLFLSVNDPFVSGSGIGSHLSGLSQALSKLGCEVHILAMQSKNSKKPDCVINGVQVHYLNPVGKLRFGHPLIKGLLFNLMSTKEVQKLCNKYQIDLIHGQSPSSYIYGLLRKDTKPFVVTLHATSFGEIISRFGIPFSLIKLHDVYDIGLETIMALLTCIEYKRADKVIGVSKAIAKEAALFYGLPSERVVAIHNGLDILRFTDECVKEKRDDYTILSVGRLTWTKGFKYLLDAMPIILTEYPNAKLLIVGEGLQKNFLQRYTTNLGIENSVQFLGSVSAEMLYSLYHEVDVYVQPSLYEPFGITILEAMSMRKTVIATRVGGIPELITDGVDGLLVESGNGPQLAKALTKIFSDPSCRKRLGSNARKKVQKEFNWDTIAKKTLELYTNSLKK